MATALLLTSVFAQAQPQTAISLSPHITELVYAAGAGDRLIAVDKYSDWPKETEKLSKVADAFTINVESLVALSPDIILVWDSGTSQDKVAQLRRANLNVALFEPTDLETIADDIVNMGQLFGTEEVAEIAAANYRQKLNDLRAIFAGKPPISVFYQIAAQPLFTVGKPHLINQALALCGGENIFSDQQQLAPAVSLEAVLSRRPQVVIATKSTATEEQNIRDTWLKRSFVPAAQNDNIYFVNADTINRSGPRLVEGVEEICTVLEAARAKSIQ